MGNAIAELNALLQRQRDRDLFLEVERRVIMAVPPVDIPEDTLLCQMVRQVITDVVGADPGFAGLRGTTDAATFQAVGIPTLIFGPGSLGKAAHRADESVALDEVHAAARVLALTIIRLLA